MSVPNAELISRAKALTPVFADRAAEVEASRKPHDGSIQDLIDAGIMQMLVPAKWGGAESNLQTMFEVVEAVSAGCISTGWITSFYINHNVYVAKFDPKVHEEVFGERGFTLMPGATAPTMQADRVDGGWKVSGKASWGSGIMHADWALVSAITNEGPRTFMLPANDVSIGDVWHYTGMGGTGSNDILIENAFVPDHRAINGGAFRNGPTEGSAQYSNPLYSVPILPLAYCTVVGVLSGGLQGAMDAFEKMVTQRVRNFSGAVAKEQQNVHITLGELRIATRVAHELAQMVISKTQGIIDTREFTIEDRLELKGYLAFLSKHCRETINAMMANAGASSFHKDQPLQRFWRDMNTVCSHAFWDWDVTREQTGRVALGLEVTHPLV